MLIGVLKGFQRGERGFEEAYGEFHLKDLPHSLVDPLHRDPSGLDSTDQGLEIIVSLHVHVYSCLDGTDKRLCRVRCPMMHRMKSLDVHPVAHHKAVKAKLISE